MKRQNDFLLWLRCTFCMLIEKCIFACFAIAFITGLHPAGLLASEQDELRSKTLKKRRRRRTTTTRHHHHHQRTLKKRY